MLRKSSILELPASPWRNKSCHLTSAAGLLAFVLVLSPSVYATNGYFSIGYGAKSMSMTGAGVAHPQDTLSAAQNPAGMYFVNPGFDAGGRFLGTVREASLDCSGIGLCDTEVNDRSNQELFLVPNFGYRKKSDGKYAFGISTYGNGGINTNYHRPIYTETAARIAGATPGTPGFPATETLGANFSQLIIAPTLSFRLSDKNVIGISPLLGLQQFRIRGLRSFAPLSTDASSLSNRGTSWTYGLGVRLGWIGQLTPDLKLGASWSSKIYMAKFEKYNGLLAENGDFDAPEHFTIGLAWQAKENLTLVFDVQRILFGNVKALGNLGPTAQELAGTIASDRLLGGKNGIGFGWRNQTVLKVAADYQLNDRWTLRAGYNHGTSQIPDSQMLFNLLSPATINDNIAMGVSYRPNRTTEYSVALMHAFKKTGTANNTAFFGTRAKGWIYQGSIDLSYARKFD